MLSIVNYLSTVFTHRKIKKNWKILTIKKIHFYITVLLYLQNNSKIEFFVGKGIENDTTFSQLLRKVTSKSIRHTTSEY